MHRFSSDCRKANAKVILPRSIRTINQLEFLAITRTLLEAREKSRVQRSISFSSHWFKSGARFCTQSLRVAIAKSLSTVTCKLL